MYRSLLIVVFFFNDTATTEIYTLSLHDALPILLAPPALRDFERNGWTRSNWRGSEVAFPAGGLCVAFALAATGLLRSGEHTSELQSRQYLVCRLLLEKKKMNSIHDKTSYADRSS